VIAGQLQAGQEPAAELAAERSVARVGDDETTALATVVSYGEQASRG